MEIKITKRELLKKNINDMEAREWWLVHGKIYNDDKTFSKRFRVVIDFEWQDIQDYFEKDSFTDADRKQYINVLVDYYTCYINDFDHVKEFYNMCNETITNYNNKRKAYCY